MVWFLAPNVALCEQQYEVFKTNLPGYGIQMLSGQDGVDHWTEQSIWDTVLRNVRIVMSTPQVLYDALAHAFVKMSQLALLIFDEGWLLNATPQNCTLIRSQRTIAPRSIQLIVS
jgi:ERCC4-related helicase